MPPTQDQWTENPNKQEDGIADPQTVQSIDEALDKIDRILYQMLLLAELSASDGTVGTIDRELLQKVLERLQSKIDCIADTL